MAHAPLHSNSNTIVIRGRGLVTFSKNDVWRRSSYTACRRPSKWKSCRGDMSGHIRNKAYPLSCSPWECCAVVASDAVVASGCGCGYMWLDGMQRCRGGSCCLIGFHDTFKMRQTHSRLLEQFFLGAPTVASNSLLHGIVVFLDDCANTCRGAWH